MVDRLAATITQNRATKNKGTQNGQITGITRINRATLAHIIVVIRRSIAITRTHTIKGITTESITIIM